MAKKTISYNDNAAKAVGDINDNFDELYGGAGGAGGAASVPTKRVKVYDVMTRCYGGAGAGTIQVSCEIKKGTKYVIEKSELGTNWSLITVSIGGGSSTQQLLKTQSGTTTGSYDTEIEASVDGTYFSIYSYATGLINIIFLERYLPIAK